MHLSIHENIVSDALFVEDVGFHVNFLWNNSLPGEEFIEDLLFYNTVSNGGWNLNITQV